MNSTEDFKAVIAAVSRVTGIPEDKIFSRRGGREYFDARWLAVQILIDLGYYDRQISEVTGMTQRGINKIRAEVQKRANGTWKQFGKNLETVRNAFGISPTA